MFDPSDSTETTRLLASGLITRNQLSPNNMQFDEFLLILLITRITLLYPRIPHASPIIS